MPIFGMDNGLGEANIGQLMLLSGLFAILFGAGLCKIVAKKMPALIMVFFPILLNAGALYLFSLNVSVQMLLVVILLIAVVNIFSSANTQTFFSLLYQSEGINSIKALGAYSVVENLGLAVGPVVFSYILTENIGFGMKIIAAAIFGCALLFGVISRISIKWSNKTVDAVTTSGSDNA